MPVSVKNDPRRRVIKASKSAQAAVVLESDAVKIMGTEDNFIAVDKTGVYIKGPLSLVGDGPGIRRAGLFVQMPDLVRMMPSTLFTPFPSQIPLPPIKGIVNITRDLAFFTALLV